MSINEFKEAMKNEGMKREYEAYIDEKKPETLDALAEAVVDFAAVKGYSISKEDVINSIPDELKYGKVELSDDMLDTVVGGGYLQDWGKEIAENIEKWLENSGWL